LVSEFNRQGYSCIRVQSTPQVPAEYRSGGYRREDFVADIVHDGNLSRTLTAVAALSPAAVAAGSDAGAALADLIAESLGLPGNGTALSQARRDTYTALETVRAAGLRAVRQLRAGREEELVRWHRGAGGRIVVRAAPSAAGDRLFFCDTPEQSAAAFRALTGGREADGGTPAAGGARVTAQEYLPGTEYLITTVSRDGRHRVCEIWRSSRLSANGVADLRDALCLVGAEAPEVEALTGYAFEVLDVLGVRHGPAHLEIRMTSVGPCLVDAGARLPGSRPPGSGLLATARLGVGESQLEWTVDAYLRPERFHRRAAEPYRVRSYCAVVAMVSPVEGVLRSYCGLNEVRGLESFHGLATLVQPGQRLRRTVDDLTHPVLVTLRHEVGETVLRDVNTLRYLDGVGLYEIEDGQDRSAAGHSRPDMGMPAPAGRS
jgi:biotin carboxylase